MKRRVLLLNARRRLNKTSAPKNVWNNRFWLYVNKFFFKRTRFVISICSCNKFVLSCYKILFMCKKVSKFLSKSRFFTKTNQICQCWGAPECFWVISLIGRHLGKCYKRFQSVFSSLSKTALKSIKIFVESRCNLQIFSYFWGFFNKLPNNLNISPVHLIFFHKNQSICSIIFKVPKIIFWPAFSFGVDFVQDKCSYIIKFGKNYKTEIA